MTDRLCTLEAAIGTVAPCPEDVCPFWTAAGCGLDGIRADIATNPELAGYLLDIRASAELRIAGGDSARLRGVSSGGLDQADGARGTRRAESLRPFD